MTKYISKFFGLTANLKCTFTEAVLFLFSAKVLLLILPVKTVLKISLTQNKETGFHDMAVLKDIKWALRNADRLSFWKNRCLVQSLAGRWMLQRRGIPAQLSFGIRHDEKKRIYIHAWLKTGNFEIVEIVEDYKEILRV